MSITLELVLANVGASQQRRRDETNDKFSQRLFQLSLNDQSLKDMEGVEHFPNLRLLYLRNNQITQISHLDHLHLTHLDLQYNCIERLDGLSACPALTHLYLSYNRIKEVISLEGPKNLQELHLSGQNLGSTDDSDNPPHLIIAPEVLEPVAVCAPITSFFTFS